jgi:hypothetical protein
MSEEEEWSRLQASIAPPIAYVTFLYFTESKPIEVDNIFRLEHILDLLASGLWHINMRIFAD